MMCSLQHLLNATVFDTCAVGWWCSVAWPERSHCPLPTKTPPYVWEKKLVNRPSAWELREANDTTKLLAASVRRKKKVVLLRVPISPALWKMRTGTVRFLNLPMV